MHENKIMLHFAGGPLDGSARREVIPAEWLIIRYEHRRGKRRHVYTGRIRDGEQQVHLTYAGSAEAEASK